MLSTLSSDRAELPGEPDPLKGLDETWKACRKQNSQISKRNMINSDRRIGVSINHMLSINLREV